MKIHAARRGLLFGFAVDTRELREDAAYRQIVIDQASILVPENEMKWSSLRPAPGQFDFSHADQLLTFAETNRIRMRGHTLVWHRQMPQWFSDSVTADSAEATLKEHIGQVAGRYAGRMHSWDVVNEAIELKDGRGDGLRNSPWLQLLGPDYIEMAFRAARAADPKALLTYNDYGIEQETYAASQKRAAILLLLRRLVARRVPVDAVGIQSHITARSEYGYGKGLRTFLSEVRELGLQVFLTEMDVNDRNLGRDEKTRDDAVAKEYGDYARVVLDDPSVTLLLTWGVSDRHTWLDGEESRTDGLPERPLLLDTGYRVKPAFFTLRDAIDGRTNFHQG